MAIKITTKGKDKVVTAKKTKTGAKVLSPEAITIADRIAVLDDQLQDAKAKATVLGKKMTDAKAKLFEAAPEFFAEPGATVAIEATSSTLKFGKERESTHITDIEAVIAKLAEIDEELPGKILTASITDLRKYLSEMEVEALTEKVFGGAPTRSLKVATTEN